MAYYYGLKYQGFCYNKGLGKTYVNIYKKDYYGSTSPLTIPRNGLEISVDTKEYFDPFISTSISINIVNNKTNFYELDDLFSISDLEYRVQVGKYDTSTVYFNGFIPCDVVEQKWLKNGIVNLNATCNLNRLDQYTPTILANKGIYKLIDIIKNCLSFTNLDLPIYINCTLREVSKTVGTNTCFDQTLIDADVFYKNNIEIEDCKSVLEKILTTYSCFIYYYNDAWYIERLKDVGTQPKNYIKYLTNGTVTDVEDPNTHLTIQSGFICKDQSQQIAYKPGLKKIELSLQEQTYNLTNYYYNDITVKNDTDTIETEDASIKYWNINEDIDSSIITNFSWSRGSNNKNIIKTGLHTHNTLDVINYNSPSTTPSIHSVFDNIDTNWVRWDEFTAEQKYDSFRSSAIGLYTKIKISYNSDDQAKITLSLKFALPQAFLGMVYDGWSNFFLAQYDGNHNFYVRFFLYYKSGPLSSDRWWVIYNKEEEIYQIVNQTDIAAGSYIPAIIAKSINFDSFTDKLAQFTEFTTDILLDSEIKSITGDNPEFILGICGLGYNWPQYCIEGSYDYDTCNFSFKENYFGDIIVSVDNEKDNNLIIGEINNDFVNVEQDDIYLYDSLNYNILNGLLKDSSYNHTTTWYDSFNPTTYLPITKFIIEDRFQIYNKVRRELNSDFYSTSFIKPFTLIDPSILNKTFYANGFKYNLDSHTYKNMNLKEYVGNDNIS